MASDASNGRQRASLSQVFNNEWFPPGLLFIAFGALGLYVSRAYDMGDVHQMGPGWFPRALCIGLVGLGAVICWRGLFEQTAAQTDGNVSRGFLMVLLSMIAFGLSIERLGFVAALCIVVLVASWARRDQKIREVLLTMAIIVVTSVAVFIYALKLPFRLWPDLALLTSYLPGT